MRKLVVSLLVVLAGPLAGCAANPELGAKLQALGNQMVLNDAIAQASTPPPPQVQAPAVGHTRTVCQGQMIGRYMQITC